MAISLKTTGSWAETTTDPTTCTLVGSPAAGDRYFLWVVWKAYDTTCQVVSPQTWTEITEFADGTVAAGANVGSVKVACFYRDWQSGDGNPSIDWSAGPVPAVYVMQLWQKGAGDDWATPQYATAASASSIGPVTRSASGTVNVGNGAVVFALWGIRDDSATFTRGTSDIDVASGITWNGNYVESPATHISTTTSNDISADLGHRFVTTGATNITLRSSYSALSATETGAVLWVVQSLLPLGISATVKKVSASFGGAHTGPPNPVVASVGAGLAMANSTSMNVPVPSGVVNGSCVLMVGYTDTQTSTVTAPDGTWTQAIDSPVTNTSAGAHRLHLYYHRATGNESGTYAFTCSANYRAAVALRLANVVDSGDPFDDTASNTGFATTTPAVNVITVGPDRLLLWAYGAWGSQNVTTPAGGTWTQDFDYYENVSTGDSSLCVAHIVQSTQGDSGTVQGSISANDNISVWLGALKPPATGTTGTIIVTEKKVVASLTGAMQPQGTIAAQAKKLQASLSGAQTHTGTVTATTKKVTASFGGTAGGVSVTGTVTTTIKKTTASVVGSMPFSGTMVSTIKKVVASFTGSMHPKGVADVTIKKVVANLAGQQGLSGNTIATIKKVVANFSARMLPTGTIAASIKKKNASFTGTHTAWPSNPLEPLITKLTTALSGRILAIGDSTVIGSGDGQSLQGWPGRMANILGQYFDVDGYGDDWGSSVLYHSSANTNSVTVFNRGVGATGIDDCEFYLSNGDYDFDPAPDAIFIGDGFNDINIAGLTPAQFLAAYQTFVTHLRTRYPNVPIVVTTENVAGGSYLGDFDDAFNALTNWLVGQNMPTNPALALSGVAGVYLLDTQQAYGSAYHAELMNDSIHPNASGYLQQATWMLQQMGVSQGVTGTINSAIKKVVASFNGYMSPKGNITSSLKKVVASTTGSQTYSGTITSAVKKLIFSATGAQNPAGVISVTSRKLTASLSGTQIYSGTMVSAVHKLSANIVGSMYPQGIVSSTLKKLSTAMYAAGAGINGLISSSVKKTVASISGTMLPQGTVASTVHKVVAALSGSQIYIGTISSNLRSVTSSFAGQLISTGTIGGLLQRVSATVNGEKTYIAAISTVIQRLSSSLAGYSLPTGTIGVVIRKVVSSVSGSFIFSSSIASTLKKVVSVFNGAMLPRGTIVAALRIRSTVFSGRMLPKGTIVSALKKRNAVFVGAMLPKGTMAGALKRASASFSGGIAGTLTGALRKLTGALAGIEHPSGAIASSVHKLTSAVVGAQIHTGSIDLAIHKVVTTFVGSEHPRGIVVVTTKQVVASLSGKFIHTATVSSVLRRLSSNVVGTEYPRGTIAGTLHHTTSSLVGFLGGTANSMLKPVTALFAGEQIFVGAIATQIQRLTALLTALYKIVHRSGQMRLGDVSSATISLNNVGAPITLTNLDSAKMELEKI